MYDLEILEYLKKNGPANTFRLARTLSIDRGHLLDIIERLEAKGAVTVRSGMVQFLQFLREERVISEPKKEAPHAKLEPSNEKSKIREFVQSENLKSENKLLKEKLLGLESSMKELEKKASAHPKTITRIVTKTVIKKIRSPPKIITRIVTKNVPIIKTVVKRIPSPKQPGKIREQTQKIKVKIQRFKFPKFKLMNGIKKLKLPKSKLLESIQKLKKPEFLK